MRDMLKRGLNPLTGRPGPAPHPPRDGDRVQARQRINVEVRMGRRPRPNSLPCVDCGHIHSEGGRRHEYDHHLGYAAAHHYDVEAVCTDCHAKRDSAKKAQTHCRAGPEFTAENTRNARNGTRHCRECARALDRQRVRPPGYWAKINQRRKENLDGRKHGD